MSELYFQLPLAACIGLAVLYLRGYINKKSENLATKEDIGEITREVEEVKSAYQKNLETLKASFESLKSTYHAADEKRIEAISVLWNSILEIDNKFLLPFGIVDLISPEQLKNTKNKILEDELSLEKITQNTSSFAGVNKQRPFLGEKLYSLFFSYQALNGAIAYQLLEIVKKESRLNNWIEAPHVLALMKAVLSTEEIEAVLNNSSGTGRIRIMNNILKQKTLAEIYEVLSGKSASAATLNAAQKLIDMSDVASKERLDKMSELTK